MVISKEMKRKRKEDCASPFLDESPKRTKVHAQRKFAQGSNVNSPVITPVKEIEKQDIDIMPEPVELLPIKRPNTEDFLTFLCFRGTPILPPSLNFFNTASIVDTNGQVHEIKSESPKNGPIDTSAISKSGSGSSERPFIAFGVRKRADPIVISRQMDRKRRHALALQALRRKYQEQRMAKIRAVTISKLSEKVTNKTLVRSNSVTKTETVTKKTSMIQKSNKVSVVATKQVKVTTETVKTTLRPQIKPKMCLRSFRGRFVQKELQFRNVKKKPVPLAVKKIAKKVGLKKNEKESSEYSSDDDEPLAKTSQEKKVNPKVLVPKVCKKSAPGPKKPSEINFRITRSNKFLNNKMTSRRQQLKQLILTTPKTIVKPRTLRSHSAQKGDTFPKPKLLSPAKQKLMQMRKQKELEKATKESAKKEIPEVKKSAKMIPVKKDIVKKEVTKVVEESKKEPVKSVEVPKKATIKIADNAKKQVAVPSVVVKGKVAKTVGTRSDLKIIETLKRREQERIKLDTKKIASVSTETDKSANKSADNQIKKDVVHKKNFKSPPVTKKEPTKIVESNAKKESKTVEVTGKKEDVVKGNTQKTTEQKEAVELKTSQRPTRKTKEAAAIYMEILSHKLVNEDKIDDDNVSIDSFPELPNVKKTEQRENELKAQAKSSKTSEIEVDNKKNVKNKEHDIVETKNLRSLDKKKGCSQKKIEPYKATEAENDAEINEMVLKGIEKIDFQLKEKTDSVESKVDEKKSKKSLEETKKVVTKVKENSKDEASCDRKTRSSVTEKAAPKTVSLPVDKIKEVELKVHINPIDFSVEKKIVNKENVIKRKLNDHTNEESESEDSGRQVKIKKPAEISVDFTTGVEAKKSRVVPGKSSDKTQVDVTRRQTRNSSQNIKEMNSDDSDESFRVDVKIPKKTQVTRSKVSKSFKGNSDGSEISKPSVEIKKVLRSNTKSYTEFSSTESDQSTTSDVNMKPVKPTGKTKRFTKTRSQVKGNQSFSDSDEEPLSKLTQSKTSGIQETKTVSEDKQLNETKDIETRLSPKPEISVKPKRECAKRPQNYLPMFSSSDDEDKYFHGFKMKNEPKKTAKIVEETCSHLPLSSDLSFKDIGRRFGKGKVNMSNEQIEKWLKDSAMAGSSIKTENDEMLKFGEKIPTETSFNIANTIDTQKLKTSLLLDDEEKPVDLVKKEVKALPKPSFDKVPNKVVAPKSLLVDRKLIFRKDKVFTVPNVNAFSASNESSVYAFGEESEEIMKTPFRRPSRRPSSTATSRSEDELSKVEDVPKPAQFRKPLTKQDVVKKDDESEEIINVETDDDLFYTPTQPSKLAKSKAVSSMSCSMVPPAAVIQRKLTDLKNSMKSLRNSADTGDEFKYKIPSSPSASSSSSAKLYKRQNLKFRAAEVAPVTLNEFPANGPGQLVEGLTFHPTEKEFQDPIEYIEKIRPKAEQFGICRIVPPSTFKPECKVTDDMRFTAYNQYVHKLLHRWGPNFKELMAIKKYLSTQNISLTHPPWIGGMEIDLPRLYQTVQLLGGLKEVIEKKKWPRVSDAMKIPKSAQDRVTKLDDIYCKYLLPYDTLSPAEREKLFDEVETEWAKRESKLLLKAQQNLTEEVNESESESDNEAEECIVKGRNMALNAFYRIARNTMSMWFKTSEPSAQEVEQEYWKHVTLKQNHLCVHSGSIDSGSWGYGFAVSKNSPFARHAWNLKVLTNNSGSVLRSLGPIMGVTVPTLHVGMVFSSCCWYRDPHSLPWIEYLHTGGNKIWYGIPDSTSASFQSALKKLVPNYCRNKSLWLPSDTVMVPPNLLVESGVSLSRIVQEPGQFIVVFPKVFTSSISTGYVVSESVYFAPPHWLNSARVVFEELRNSCEPSMLSLDRLVLSIVNDHRSSVEVLRQVIPFVKEICDKEKTRRAKIKSLGVTAVEKLPLPEAPNARKRKRLQDDDGDYECEFCRMNLFVSMVTESQEDGVYCLDHAIEQIEKKKVQSKNCKLSYTYDDDELEGLPGRINSIIESKLQKKIPHKFSGMPTLLTK